ncbi:ClpXP protease specificity-enhancing factor [Thalassomonas viridans]|nr:ClpXP protease specificity-enhancing factor [Thalassomonas viridans]
MTSNKPYLVKAFYDWISDNQLTPYIVVDVSVYGVLVPMSYVNDGQIVLNVSASAVGSIALGSEAIDFTARFGGKLEHLCVPYGAIAAIYAKENGAGTSLPIEHPEVAEDAVEEAGQENEEPGLTAVTSSDAPTQGQQEPSPAPAKGKPSLKVVK